jgi:putative acetyltransferase
MENLNKIKIRKVSSKDIQKISDLHRKVVTKTNVKCYSKAIIKEWLSQITPEGVKYQLKDKTTPWYLLELNSKIIGFCQFSIVEKTIFQLNIDPNHQGKGYGKTLSNFMEKRFRNAGVSNVGLNSTLNALSFYKHLGFKVKNPIKYKVIKCEMDMFEMVKALN